MEPEQKRTSPWVFIGVGCLLAVFALVAVVVAIGAWGFSQFRQIARTMEDPVARAELAAEFLVTDELPEGYNVVAAISIPFLMETAVLTDKEPGEDGQISGFGERGFIYFKMLSFGEQEQELRDFFEGRTDDSQVLRQSSGFSVDTDELIERGVIEEESRTLRWVAYRGEIDRGSSGLGEGLTTMVMFECPGAERVRMGIWFGPDPSPDVPIDEADFSGSVADPAAIRSFLAPFDVCSR